MTPLENKIISGSSDNTVRIWNMKGTLLNILKGHTDEVYSICLSPSGNRILSASYDKTIRIWNINSYKQINIL